MQGHRNASFSCNQRQKESGAGLNLLKVERREGRWYRLPVTPSFREQRDTEFITLGKSALLLTRSRISSRIKTCSTLPHTHTK